MMQQQQQQQQLRNICSPSGAARAASTANGMRHAPPHEHRDNSIRATPVRQEIMLMMMILVVVVFLSCLVHARAESNSNNTARAASKRTRILFVSAFAFVG
jgi:hypothetical protein